MEILGEWCASLDAEGLGRSVEDEEWGGIMNDMEDIANSEEGEDVEMGEDEEMENEQEQEPQESSEEDGMGVELSSASVGLIQELPKLLLALAIPTPLSFFVPAVAAAPSTAFIPTATVPAPSAELPKELTPIAEILTTIHVRALETLNNLFITLARSIQSPTGIKYLENSKNLETLQRVWENCLELILGASGIAIGKGEGEERGCEMVMAGIGAVWGIARVGLGEVGQLVSNVSNSGVETDMIGSM